MGQATSYYHKVPDKVMIAEPDDFKEYYSKCIKQTAYNYP